MKIINGILIAVITIYKNVKIFSIPFIQINKVIQK